MGPLKPGTVASSRRARARPRRLRMKRARARRASAAPPAAPTAMPALAPVERVLDCFDCWREYRRAKSWVLIMLVEALEDEFDIEVGIMADTVVGVKQGVWPASSDV